MGFVLRFLDRSGFSWSVFELGADRFGVVERSLYFLSGGSTLVLHGYPDDWSQLDWAGLDRLRQRAEVMSADITRSPLPRRAARLSETASAVEHPVSLR